jgi:hypothetical protein
MLAEHIAPPSRHWDRLDTVGASEIGQCARRVWYVKHEEPHEESGWGFKERGHHVERWVIERLRAAHVPIEHAGDDQRTLSDGFLSATPDGRLGRVSFDVKSFDPRKTRLPEEAHIFQVRLGARLDSDADQALLVYVNASDFQDIQEFGPWPELSDDEYDGAKQRARTIMTAHSPEAFLREGKFDSECTRWSCPFQAQCLGEAIEGGGKLSPEDQTRLEDLQAKYRAISADQETAEREANRIKEQFREILRAADVKSATGIGNVSRRGGRASLDTEAMERDGIDLAPYRKTGVDFDAITIRK